MTNDPTREQLDVLVQKMTLSGCRPVLYGHAYAVSVRRLYLENRLRLVSVADFRRIKREDDETDLATPASICTYDELVTVRLNEDQTVTLYIKESTVSLNSHPSVPRANFTLSGDWWAINKYGEGFSQSIERAFNHYTEHLLAVEEDLRLKARRREIEAQVLAGTYDYPEGAQAPGTAPGKG